MCLLSTAHYPSITAVVLSLCCLYCNSIWRHHWKWMLHTEFGNHWTDSQKRNPLKATKYKGTISSSESSWLSFPHSHTLPSASAVTYVQSLMVCPHVSALRWRVHGEKSPSGLDFQLQKEIVLPLQSSVCSVCWWREPVPIQTGEDSTLLHTPPKEMLCHWVPV